MVGAGKFSCPNTKWNEDVMSDFRIVVPANLVQQLEARNISRETIRKTVAASVINTLEELAAKPRVPEPKPGETANEYFRRVILERRGGGASIPR